MLWVYGFERNNLSDYLLDSWKERSRNWLKPGNHNHLRLTRIFEISVHTWTKRLCACTL